jgi:hypothetical protein
VTKLLRNAELGINVPSTSCKQSTQSPLNPPQILSRKGNQSSNYGRNTCSQLRCFKDQHSVPFRARYSHDEVSILLAKTTPVGSTILKVHEEIYHSTLLHDFSGYDTGLVPPLVLVYPLLQQASSIGGTLATQLLTESSVDDL